MDGGPGAALHCTAVKDSLPSYCFNFLSRGHVPASGSLQLVSAFFAIRRRRRPGCGRAGSPNLAKINPNVRSTGGRLN